MFPNPKNIRKYERNGFEIVEFELRGLKVQQFTIDQLNLSGHVVSGGYWVDMHISKVQFQDSDKKLFEDFVSSLYLHRK
jgi:hypothetical protein